MKFDRSSARPLFAQKETDELVRIAFLEEAYTDDAKSLAKEELALRGGTRMKLNVCDLKLNNSESS